MALETIILGKPIDWLNTKGQKPKISAEVRNSYDARRDYLDLVVTNAIDNPLYTFDLSKSGKGNLISVGKKTCLKINGTVYFRNNDRYGGGCGTSIDILTTDDKTDMLNAYDLTRLLKTENVNNVTIKAALQLVENRRSDYLKLHGLKERTQPISQKANTAKSMHAAVSNAMKTANNLTQTIPGQPSQNIPGPKSIISQILGAWPKHMLNYFPKDNKSPSNNDLVEMTGELIGTISAGVYDVKITLEKDPRVGFYTIDASVRKANSTRKPIVDKFMKNTTVSAKENPFKVRDELILNLQQVEMTLGHEVDFYETHNP